jgi:hypothetical protein
LDEVFPRDSIPAEELNQSDIVKLRNGVYAQMEDGVFSFAFDFDVRGENFRGGPGFALVDPVNMNPEDPLLLSMWRSAYNRISKANFLIEVIDDLGGAATPAQRVIRAEALYFRALMYYHLVTRWGGVPIMLERSFDVVPRSTETATWDRITADLLEVENVLPVYSSSWYVSKEAAQALLARVYLSMGNKAKAIEYADKVIGTGKFSMATDANGYASMFIASSSSKEHILALISNTASNRHLYYQLVNDVDPTWNYSPTVSLYNNLYGNTPIKSGDRRRTAVFLSNDTRITKFPNGRTGQQLVTTSNADFTPISISRITELILIKAEAQGNGSAAYTTLAPYFANRYATPPTAAQFGALTNKEFEDLILDERQREFYGESFRWHDIKRTNRLDLLPSLAGRTYLMYYPIPQVEKDLAGYTQNPGY